MTKVRIMLDGKILGFIPIHWTLSEPLNADQTVYASWLIGWLDGKVVKVGSVLKGTISVTVGV
jgi:hypothetical protein